MHKKVLRWSAFAMLVLMFVCLTSCLNDDTEIEDNSSVGDLSDYLFYAHHVPFPDDIGYVTHLSYNDGKLYFDAVGDNNSSTEGNSLPVVTTELYSMNIDGTDSARLSGYQPSMFHYEDNYGGGTYIRGLCIDDDGSLWIVEENVYYETQLPQTFSYDTDNLADYIINTTSVTYIRKLGTAGAEILSVDVSGIFEQAETTGIRSFTVDSSGNIYLSILRVTAQSQGISQEIFVIDTAGDILFTQAIEGVYASLIRMTDGSVALMPEPRDENGRLFQELWTIDITAKSLAEYMQVPSGAWDTYTYAGLYEGKSSGYDIVIDNSVSVFGFTTNTEEVEKLFNWSDCGAVINNIGDIIFYAYPLD